MRWPAPSCPACAGPAELYSPHARALIGRVLEDWLRREGVTAFELLHRPDVAERLEAAGVELQHAIQKVAVVIRRGVFVLRLRGGELAVEGAHYAPPAVARAADMRMSAFILRLL